MIKTQLLEGESFNHQQSKSFSTLCLKVCVKFWVYFFEKYQLRTPQSAEEVVHVFLVSERKPFVNSVLNVANIYTYIELVLTGV